AEDLVISSLQKGSACISFQVIQETLNVITRKIASPASPEDARRFLDHVLLPLWRISPSQALYHRCLDVQSRYGYGFYDSLILAAALEAGCARVYSEDLKDGQQIHGLTIRNPFTA